MLRSASVILIFLFLFGCAQTSDVHNVGFAGHRQDRVLVSPRDYDQQEVIDDSMDFHNGNFDPFYGPDDPEGIFGF
ncbi:MAG: hypothetical protein JO076_05425 [Verrucomicrobia bacterium]|nr:hypothetical protein [Verrucomicrobiota bacterium]